jgi:ribosomal protein S18 acetylase RimI-like enzyme
VRNTELDADGFAPIREATTDDVDALFAMRQAREKWFAARGIQQWEIGSLAREQIHSQVQAEQWWLLTKHGSGPAAAMRIIWSDPEFWGDRPGTGIYMHGLMVDLPSAGLGLGRRMLDFARALGVAEGVSFFRLDCAAHNAPLKQIYRDYGFDHVGQKDFPNFSVALMEITLDDRTPAASHYAACD